MAALTTIPKPQTQEVSEAAWQEVGCLRCNLGVEIRVPEFTVRELLRLEVNSLVDSRSVSSADLPVRVNGELIGWAEFELVGERLGVRITEIA